MSTWRITPRESLVLDAALTLHRPACALIAYAGSLPRPVFIEAETSWLDDTPYVGLRDCPSCIRDDERGRLVEAEMTAWIKSPDADAAPW